MAAAPTLIGRAESATSYARGIHHSSILRLRHVGQSHSHRPLVDAKRERGDRQKRRTIRFGLASEGASYRSGHLISLRACGVEPVMSRVEARYVT